MTSGSEWNPKTVKLGKVYTNNNIDEFHSQQHTFGYHTIETRDDFYLDNGTDKALIHSKNPSLVKMGAKLKRNI